MPSSSEKQRNYVLYLRGKNPDKKDEWYWNDDWLTIKEHKDMKVYKRIFKESDVINQDILDEVEELTRSFRKKYLALSSDERRIKAAKEIGKQFKVKFQDILKNYNPDNNIKDSKTWDKNGNLK